jgi:hypothetical protein
MENFNIFDQLFLDMFVMFTISPTTIRCSCFSSCAQTDPKNGSGYLVGVSVMGHRTGLTSLRITMMNLFVCLLFIVDIDLVTS